MTTQTIFALGNLFAYTDSELRINGVLQSEDRHESFCDFLQGAYVDGVFNEIVFCELYNVKELKKPNLKARNYLLDIITKEEHYNNIDAIKEGIYASGGYMDFFQGLTLSIEFMNDACVNKMIEFGYKNASPDMYWAILARELQVIIDKKLI